VLSDRSGNVFGQSVWFGKSGQRVAGILHSPSTHSNSGVVICAPIGYEAWCSYKTLRTLAIDLAKLGFYVLRLDYYGTGDSEGSYPDSDMLSKWDASLESACDFLRNLNVKELCFVGLRFGASLAVRNSEKCGISQLLLWDPVISGRRFVKEIKMLSVASPSNDNASDELQVAGSIYSQNTIDDISEIDLLKLSHTHIKQLYLIDREDRPISQKYFETLNSLNVDRTLMSGTAEMLDVPTEYGIVPKNIVDKICDIVKTSFFASNNTLESQSSLNLAEFRATTISWEGKAVLEEQVSIGANKLFGIIGSPATESSFDKIVIFLNSGTEHHIGPGRVWVEFARSLNVLGYSTMRVDFNGMGESSIRGKERKIEPYDESRNQDVDDYLQFCRQRGYKKIILVGLCSSAWMLLFFAETTKVDGVISINPQLYYKLGEPMPVLVADFRKGEFRKGTNINIEQVEAFGNQYHIWTFLEILHIRPRVSKLLMNLNKLSTKVLLIYGEADPGLTYLRTRIGYRIRSLLKTSFFKLEEIRGMDHPMHRHTKRPMVKKLIADFVREL
jgi:alpha/beta superfamily hydrolase